MKKFLKKYGAWLILCVVVLLVAVSLFLNDFQITYNPQSGASWASFSAIATAVATILSILAIVFALLAPKQVAKQQYKIALFEKRFACYMAIQDMLGFASSIEKERRVGAIKSSFILSEDNSGEQVNQFSLTGVIINIRHLEKHVIAGDFLFQKYPVDLLQQMLGAAGDLMTELYSPFRNRTELLTLDECKMRDDLCKYADLMKNQYLENLEQELNIKG